MNINDMTQKAWDEYKEGEAVRAAGYGPLGSKGNPVIINSSTTCKEDIGKVKYSLIDKDFLEGLAKVRMMGDAKYFKDSWKEVENGEERFFDALLRHAYSSEAKDKESGLSHWLHVAANAMFLHYLEEKGNATI